ncbi:glycosyltransferase [bacterium]|nr:glycosyltransferase [candidate division CSSED10-310 bacterium]
MSLKMIIPAWNEAGQIDMLFRRIASVGKFIEPGWAIFIIDDGSTDTTIHEIELFQSMLPIKILRHPENRGVSEAFRTGFDAVMKESCKGDVILTIEANKNADLSILPRMLELSRRGTDLVLASCYAPGGAVVGDPFLRYALSMGVNLMLRIVFPFQHLHTYTSFYRLWSYELVAAIRQATDGRYFRQDGFVCMADMLLEARKIKGIKIQEIPLIVKSDIKESGSKMKIARTIMGYLRMFISQKFR